MNFRKVIAATGIVGALVFTSACSSPEPASAPVQSPSGSASSAPTATAEPTAATVALKMPAGITIKGVANDGVGDYLQTSISDDDPAMKYNPAIADAGAKAHYSEAELAEAQKVVVKFIAEEAIDSTLNGGKGNVDVWWNTHKNQIHPLNQDAMLIDLKNPEKAMLSTERWMAEKPTPYTYVHGTETPRVTARTITPLALRFVESANLQGVMLDTNVTYSMEVTDGKKRNIQNSTGKLSFAVAKDPADGGKWKIAGYLTDYKTLEG